MLKIVLFVTCLAVSYQLTEAKLNCLQCANTLQPCLAKDATSVTCSNNEKSRCLRQIKSTARSGTTDTCSELFDPYQCSVGYDEKTDMAIRKCVILDIATNNYACAPGTKCFTCTGDDCNSATALKFSSFALLGVIVALLASKIVVN